jgi:hypothetical protein
MYKIVRKSVMHKNVQYVYVCAKMYNLSVVYSRCEALEPSQHKNYENKIQLASGMGRSCLPWQDIQGPQLCVEAREECKEIKKQKNKKTMKYNFKTLDGENISRGNWEYSGTDDWDSKEQIRSYLNLEGCHKVEVYNHVYDVELWEDEDGKKFLLKFIEIN